MQIPQSCIDEGLIYLHNDEDALLEKLGIELSIFETASQSLGTRLNSEQYQQKAKEYFDSKSEVLKSAICPNWEKKRDDFSDTGDVLVALSTIVAEALNLSISYIALAVLIAVIIIKKGITNFCN